MKNNANTFLLSTLSLRRSEFAKFSYSTYEKLKQISPKKSGHAHSHVQLDTRSIAG